MTASHAAGHLAILAEAGLAFSEATVDMPRLLDRIAGWLTRVVGDLVLIHVASEEGDWMELVAIDAVNPELATAARETLLVRTRTADHSLAAAVAEAGSALFLPAVTSEALRAQLRPEVLPLLDQFGVSGLIIVPMRARGQLVGVLSLGRTAAGVRAYVPEDLHLAQDLAERAALALDNARLYSELELRVTSRTAELRSANRRLLELDKVKSNFVNAVTHELRTPLTAVRGYAELLEDEVGGPLSPEQKVFVAQIQAGSERLRRLVDDLLDFARMDAGTFALKPEVEDIVARTCSIIESIRPQADAGSVKLDLVLPESPLHVQMDGERIGQVVANLLSNALKYTPGKGTITVCIREAMGGVRVEVSDTGLGISEAEMPLLFQRFSQLAGAHAGTGLGLSICKALVEAHGGHIGVDSQVGVGSTFWFTLPGSSTLAP